MPPARQGVLRLLSGFDITPAQIQVLLDGATEVELTTEELLDNPYYASTCTYGMVDHIPFMTIDRALFPPDYVSWKPSIPDEVTLNQHIDRCRIEALPTDVLERQGNRGDTLVPEGEAIELANAMPLAQPPNLSRTTTTVADRHAGAVPLVLLSGTP